MFLLDLFRTELETHSRVLEEGLVEAEARHDAEKLQGLMRAAHSLKGACRILALDSAVRLAHAMEDMLSAAQKGGRQLASPDFDLLLRSTDVFSRLAKANPPTSQRHWRKNPSTLMSWPAYSPSRRVLPHPPRPLRPRRLPLPLFPPRRLKAMHLPPPPRKRSKSARCASQWRT